MTHRIRRVGHIQMCNAFFQILWRSWARIKMQTLETFSVITVQVRIFSALDRNDLKYSLRICEIFLVMNTNVLFLVICLASAILYVTRHLVIYEGLCVIFGRSRHEKGKRKKNATQNLTRCLIDLLQVDLASLASGTSFFMSFFRPRATKSFVPRHINRTKDFFESLGASRPE